jgi:predicted transcriptional regulator
MSVGDVFNNNKWDIIKDLSEKKFSPIELAQRYNTTVGNIGHQLRLLEAYGLIKKEKVPNRDKGKPRTLFSLAYNCAYLVSATNGFARKRLLKLSDYHDTILKMWFIDDPRIHYFLEKFYWKIEDYIDLINGIAVKTHSSGIIEVIILTSMKKELRNKIGSKIVIENKNKGKITFNLQFVNKDELKDFALIKDYFIVYDPNKIFSCYKEAFV